MLKSCPAHVPLEAALLVRALAASIILSTSAIAIAAPATAEKLAIKLPATQLKFYALVYRSDSGTVGEIRVNDMPAVTWNGEGGSGFSIEVQAWLQAGTNRIEIILDKVGAGDEPAKLSLHGLATRAAPDDSNELVHITLTTHNCTVTCCA